MKSTPSPLSMARVLARRTASRHSALPHVVWLLAASALGPLSLVPLVPSAHAIPPTEKTPPAGIPVPAEDREKLLRGANELGAAIQGLEGFSDGPDYAKSALVVVQQSGSGWGELTRGKS